MSIHDNPYLSQIMSAVDMLAAESLAERRRQQELEYEKQRQEEIFKRQQKYQEEIGKRQQAVEGAKRQYEYWKTIASDPNIDPNLKAEAYRKMGEAISMMNPNMQNNFPEVQFKTYKLDPKVAQYFGLPADAPWTREEIQQITTKYRELTRPRGAGGSSSKQPTDPVLKRLKVLEESAIRRYEKGRPVSRQTIDPATQMPVTKFGRKPIDDELYTQYLDKIEMLRQKRLSGQWTKEDEREYKRLKNFDIYLNTQRKKRALRDAIKGAEPAAAHKQDPLGLRGIVQ